MAQDNGPSSAAFQVLERFAAGQLSAEAAVQELTPILSGREESVDQRLSRAGEQREQQRRIRRGEQ